MLGDVPVKNIERVIKGMELSDLLEELEPAVANLRVGKVGDRGVSSTRGSVGWISGKSIITHGQDMTETRRMPTIIALLTLYAIRYAVNMPPAVIPSHIYHCSADSFL
jgi:hypothetical protein